ncbi:hypothetical protein ACFVH7_27115 [Kitasatospora indigofera]|uniref:hypothetical protein n=1 Tax=Kitasatospora indigofera TaxID=67307 RepID=UPI00364274A4
MPQRRTRHPHSAGPPPATEQAVAAVLAAKGWRPAPAPGDLGPGNDGDFSLRAEPAAPERPHPGVLLWCLTDSYVSTLAAMTGVLEDAGYTAEDAPDVDSIRLRAATPDETDRREHHARQRVAPLAALLLPERASGPDTLF